MLINNQDGLHLNIIFREHQLRIWKIIFKRTLENLKHTLKWLSNKNDYLNYGEQQ